MLKYSVKILDIYDLQTEKTVRSTVVTKVERAFCLISFFKDMFIRTLPGFITLPWGFLSRGCDGNCIVLVLEIALYKFITIIIIIIIIIITDSW